MFMKERIVGMLESLRSQTEMSRILNVDQSAISRLWQGFRRSGYVTRQPVSGRPRVTTPNQDRYLVISAYRDEVLEPYVCLFRGAVGPDFIFLDDNAPYHRAVRIDDFFETENIQRISWPANSPDLNPIEWIYMGYARETNCSPFAPTKLRYRTEKSSPRSLEHFEAQLIHHLIASMVNRCAACLAVRGNHTPY
ncbi:transposable element Tcb2 transposase [Trichonephila clavipes]|nr:transposable element Tcb2 transposase [Trichonephila clavipes]